jgi:hypothetical protein
VDGELAAGAQSGKRLDFLAANMAIKGLGDLVREGFDFAFIALGMQIDPAVSEVLDVSRHVITSGQTEDLGTKTDPLDVASVPDITMGDMG